MHEENISKVISHFGTYLGTLEPEASRELSIWSTILATIDLTLVLKNVSFMAGEVETVASLQARRWVIGPVY
jgi:hypothetical protein